jgi:hypothetical protein
MTVVVTADCSSDGSGNMTIPISPTLVASGAYQNCTSLPLDNATITVLGTAGTVTPQGMAFHSDAFTLVSADLEDVGQFGAWGSVVRSKKLGISLRVARQYNISSDVIPCRIDVLFDFATLYPELACRIAS